jgi:hypothetical protein
MKTLTTLAAAALVAFAAIAAPAPAEAARGRNAALAIIGLAGAAVAGAIIAGSQQPAYAGWQGHQAYGDHYAPAPVYRPRRHAPIVEDGYGGGYGYGNGYGYGGGHVVRQRPRFVEHPPVARCNIVQEPVFDLFGYQVGIRNRRVCF